MNKEGNNILISIDFRSEKGGIARVAHLIYRSLDFCKVLSLHGNEKDCSSILYFNQKRILLVLTAFLVIIQQRPKFLVFDHLNLARLLVLLPNAFLNKTVIFLHDEEAWIRVTGFRRIALKRATHLVCNSEFTRKHFLQHNFEFSEKTYVCLPGGVPDAFYDLNEEKFEGYSQWFEDPRPYVLFVSRLWKAHRYKGYFELMQAFKAHYEKYHDAHLRLVLIGNGDDAAEVQHFIDKENQSQNISLFSNVDDRSLMQFYKNSLALIFPSTREGFGMVYLEAMFFKKACIGIAGQPAEEIILDSETGKLLVDNRSETIQMILEDIEHDPSKYLQFGEKGYKRYLNNFTMAHFQNRFLDILNQ